MTGDIPGPNKLGTIPLAILTGISPSRLPAVQSHFHDLTGFWLNSDTENSTIKEPLHTFDLLSFERKETFWTSRNAGVVGLLLQGSKPSAGCFIYRDRSI